MVALIIGMLICVGLAVAVVAIVAIPARREGRELLTPQGGELMAVAMEKTGDALSTAKEKVADTVTSTVQREPAEETGRHRAG
jgi:hypothetical protein